MAKRPNDDLFAETTMSFGEHLEELRGSLFRSLIGLVIGFVLGLLVADKVVRFVQTPVVAALEEYYINRAVDKTLLNEAADQPVEMINTIINQKLTRDFIKIDPQGLAEMLKGAYPDQFHDLRIKRYQFRADEIADADGDPSFAKLSAAILQEHNEEDQPAGALWKEMTDSERALVRRVAGQSEQDVSGDDQKSILAALNRLLEIDQLSATVAFTSAPGAEDRTLEAIDELKAQNDPTAVQTRRLNRLLIAAAFAGEIRPPMEAVVNLPIWKEADIQLQALNPQEAFMIWLKAAFVTGMILASPWIFWQIWIFVAAGLYPHEKKYVHIYLPFSLLLFFAGTCLAFFAVFKPVLDFLFSFNKMMDINPDPRIGEWLSFVLLLPLGFGIAFQLPLVMLFLNRIGVFTVAAYLEKWRIAILVIFVISMLLTPADPISMLLLALPLTVLYFLGVGLAVWMPKNRNPYDQGAYEP